MKFISVILGLVCSLCFLNARTELKFGSDGKFKIVQFTDVHYIHKDDRSAVSLQTMKEVIEKETPDLIMLTGDVIYGKPAEKSLRDVLDLVSKYKIPFGVTFGNHDDEYGLSRAQLLKIISTYKYNLTVTEDGIKGESNFILPVKSSDNSKNAAILYCMDSNSYSKIKNVGGYDYIGFDQIMWYIKNSRRYTTENGGKPVQSYAFFHIPLPEYADAVKEQGAVMIGTRMERSCSPKLNSGMFSAMKEMGDIKGVFVGHDHDNDYAVYWHNILLAYGRYTGGNTVYNHLPNGARIIELNEKGNDFSTWIRLAGDVVVNKVVCPDNFVKK